MCKCIGMTGILLLVSGILFLLRDLGVWNFWNIQWWTVLLIIGGFTIMALSGCKEGDCCSEMCGTQEEPKTAKKRK